VWSWLLAYRSFRSERPEPRVPEEGRQWFPQAKLLVDRRAGVFLVAALGRGGVFKLFRNKTLIISDTGPSLQMNGNARVAVTHLESDATTHIGSEEIVVQGRFAWAKTTRLTPAKNVLLRLFMLSLGRFWPNLVRSVLQRVLVTGRANAPFRYRRIFREIKNGWSVCDEITAEGGWANVTAAGIGGFQSSMTTVMARVFQPDQLQPWIDLGDRIATLKPDEPVIIERHFGGETC
jgi:hypothetical protein